MLGSEFSTTSDGKAQQAYTTMQPEDAGKYKNVKQAILNRYDISEDTYQQRFQVIYYETLTNFSMKLVL